MITLEEITQRTLRLYPEFLRRAVACRCGIALPESGPLFPLVLEENSGRFTDVLRRQPDVPGEVAAHSKDACGYGYTLETESAPTRSYGLRTIIRRLYFAAEDDYLDFLEKQDERQNIDEALDVLLQEAPLPAAELDEWLLAHAPRLCDVPRGTSAAEFWHDICSCARWFRENPQSNLFLQEIPLDVPKGFIDTHKALIHSLLTSEPIRESFEADHGLRVRSPLVRFRSLSAKKPLKLGKYAPAELALPLGDFIRLDQSGILGGITHIVIVENETAYRALPACEGVLCVLGNDYTAGQLRKCPWLESYGLLYFGDIDERSLSVLSALRSAFPALRSLCMDARTLAAYTARRTHGAALPASAPEPPNLTDEERQAFVQLRQSPERNALEQGRLDADYVLRRLEERVRE